MLRHPDYSGERIGNRKGVKSALRHPAGCRDARFLLPRGGSERARQKTRAKVRRNQTRQPKARHLELAGYILVLTSLPVETFPAAQALELYRSRWQTELAFKRLKRLLGAGHLPKSEDRSARSWMQAKLLSALLLERLLLEARLSPPGGYELGKGEPLAAGRRSA